MTDESVPLRWGYGGPIIGQAVIGEDGMVSGVITTIEHAAKITNKIEDFSILDPRTLKSIEGEKLMEINEPKGYVAPTAPPANVPDGGIGNVNAPKRNHFERDNRRFAIEQAGKIIHFNDNLTVEKRAEELIKAATKIEEFIIRKVETPKSDA